MQLNLEYSPHNISRLYSINITHTVLLLHGLERHNLSVCFYTIERLHLSHALQGTCSCKVVQCGLCLLQLCRKGGDSGNTVLFSKYKAPEPFTTAPIKSLECSPLIQWITEYSLGHHHTVSSVEVYMQQKYFRASYNLTCAYPQCTTS